MSIKKLEPSLYELRLSYSDAITGKRKHIKRHFKTKGAAEAEEQVIKLKLIQKIDMQSDVKLTDFIQEFIDERKKGKVAKNTLKMHQLNLDEKIAPYFKNQTVKKLNLRTYQKFINYLIDSGLSKRSVEIIHGTIYGAMDYACILHKIEDNPCRNVQILTAREKIERKNKKKQIPKFIPTDQVKHFLDIALQDNYLYYAFFRFLLQTGTRKGEATALQWTDVDFENKIITINKSIDYDEVNAQNYEKAFSDTKTYSSVRQFVISDKLMAFLNDHKLRQDDNKFRLKDMYKNELNLVFCREDGTPFPKSTLFNAFRRILKKAEIPNLPIHSLRHTFTVMSIEAEMPLPTLQAMLGHSTPDITQRVYSHDSSILQQESVKKFDNYTDHIFI